MSTHSTRWPFSAKATARFSAVVVFATPPFWLAKAMTLALLGALEGSTKAPFGVGEMPGISAPFAAPVASPSDQGALPVRSDGPTARPRPTAPGPALRPTAG